MFEAMSDAAVVDAITDAGRAQNMASARELAAIGELYARRAPEDDVERFSWVVDGHENVVAEVAAALRISRGRARGRLRHAIALRERLPRVAEVFARGDIDFRLVAALVTRTENIDDAEVIARIDAAVARHAPKWMRLSGPKTAERIDMWVARYDPTGVRVPGPRNQDRYVEVACTDPGLAGVWAQLHATDGVALDHKLDALAATVCPDDPRTKAQRRADALGALALGAEVLGCQCGRAECTAPLRPTSGNLVIHVLAEQAAVNGDSEAPGYLAGHGPLPAELLREMGALARIRPLWIPPGVAESGYRPSTALAEFVRFRDLTCRFPGCDEPSEFCDIDHTVPFPLGPTHPSNLKLLCRYHHLLKTFHVGPDGWRDRQEPDGTVVWTSPSGREYATKPGGSLLFPALAVPTGALVLPTDPPPAENRGLMMPARRRTRAQERAARISWERGVNEARIAAEAARRAERIAASYEPPPF
ncbi:HNH endonuclease signature motif containing protein [Mycobacterium palustre]|uniref:HNH nuclease domain-containing protein n=1 Tax=Mycobacterium palustre TaxID=153971 RepID=A0A1X1ZIP8_9MYCO|nr:HNH endonuclease signature motif containing protein [Mycobacterium palustre]MCV7102698.1 HNH endonuclease [Mycobacterium palustre]ORW23208.1 hypothetical protein AWC19_11580 [Mycobacterium palustre]